MDRTIKSWLKQHFLINKLDTALGIIILGLLALVVAVVVGQMGFMGGSLMLVAAIGFLVVFASLFYPYTGLYFALIMSVLVSFLSKIVDLPYGISLDLLLVVMGLGVIMRQIKERDLSFAKSPLSLPILVWVFYCLIQVLNPYALSKMAWLYTVRSVALLILLYFIACYALSSYRRIINIFKFALALAFISALYGLKQEFFGFTDFELTWLYADQGRFQLIFQWSRLRIFSFFSDPTNYGIYMAYMGVICFILLLGPFKIWQKIALSIGGLAMFVAMAYAGSRTPFVLVPFGFGIFTLLTLKRNVLIAMVLFVMVGSVLVLKSTGSAVIYRLQSAFLPDRSGDTMNVRWENQKKIQPLIQNRPFGSGLGSTGEWGQRFAPNSLLAKFPPDSGLVRIAVELGWIGLLLYSFLLYKILNMGIRYYFRVRHPGIKVIYLALICMLFMLVLASYPQEAIIQIPTSIFFYVSLAMLTRLKDFDVEVKDG
jgi:putative inorganic carbon (HCO3(-)) transporter